MQIQPAERRTYERMPVSLAGTLISDDVRDSCAVLDFSQGGTMLSSSRIIPMDRPVRLEVNQVGVFVGRVTWRNTDRMGLRFIDLSDRSAMAGEQGSSSVWLIGLDPFIQ